MKFEIPTEDELKEKEEMNNALVNQMPPYEIEMLTGGPDYYSELVDGFHRILDHQTQNDIQDNSSQRSNIDSQ